MVCAVFFVALRTAAFLNDGAVIFWDCLSEYENRVVTVRYYDGMNYDESKKSYDKMKKECYAMVQ